MNIYNDRRPITRYSNEAKRELPEVIYDDFEFKKNPWFISVYTKVCHFQGLTHMIQAVKTTSTGSV